MEATAWLYELRSDEKSSLVHVSAFFCMCKLDLDSTNVQTSEAKYKFISQRSGIGTQDLYDVKPLIIAHATDVSKTVVRGRRQEDVCKVS